MKIDDNKIFSEEYDSDSTLSPQNNIEVVNNINYETSIGTKEESNNYSLLKPIRIIIKAKVTNDKS